MQGLAPPKHSDAYNNISRFELGNKQATLGTIQNMNADDKALLLSKLIECKYYRQTSFFNNIGDVARQNACWQFILDFRLWPMRGLSDLMAFIKNDGWDIVQGKFPAEFKKLLSNLSTDNKQKILSQFVLLPEEEQENIRVFLADATGEYWSPLEVKTLEVIINPLVCQAISSLSTSAPTEVGDLAGYLDLIRDEAKNYVEVKTQRKDKVDTLEFNIGVLLKVIAEAVDHNDVVTARKILASQLFTSYQHAFTKELILSYCGKFKEEDASIRMIELLSEIKADFSRYDGRGSGSTPLIDAAAANRVAVVKKLIEVGAAVNKGSVNTALIAAARSGNIKIVQLLINAGANIKIIDLNKMIKNFDTQHSDKLSDFCQVIELLVKAGASLEKEDSQGNTPLKNAIKKGMWSVAEFLLSLGAPITPDSFHEVIQSKNEEWLMQLVRRNHCSLPKAIPYCPSPWSSESEINLELFWLCVDSGMSTENFSLADDVVLKTPKVVKECLARDADLNINISEPNIRSLLFSGSGPGAQGCLLAHFAAACATRESLAILIHAGLDIHARDMRGLTPLHYAAAYANPEAVKLLIFAGAAIDAVDQRGMTPLHWAVQNGMAASILNLPCARILLYAGAKPDLKDKKNRTPLDCLYRESCTRSGESKWERAFKETKPAEPKKLTAKDADVPLLRTLALNAFVNNSALAKNLLYRNNFSEDLSLEIEEMASQKFTPPELPKVGSPM